MAKPKRHHGTIDAILQQLHRRGVSRHMWRDVVFSTDRPTQPIESTKRFLRYDRSLRHACLDHYADEPIETERFVGVMLVEAERVERGSRDFG